ncbi:hypothetical protein [Micromonospora yangpuensis]|uniref:hypothetical protein n=1 Tax=Micromonospora yangpuensis TaxID=683228 RepID=UPI001664848A|nr:hypothetical protein [Micromonospora yangpuensis]GGM26650.1 hypothetical protein GCM10012279_51370 [Micromonospora yangpuensis]
MVIAGGPQGVANRAAQPRRGGTAAQPRRGGTAAQPRRGGTAAQPRRGGTAAQPRRGGTAATVSAILATVLLVVVALVVALVAMFLPMAAAGCGASGTEGLLVCNAFGHLVMLGAPFGGAVLGVLLALVGFLPFPLRHRRAIFIGAGYLVVLGGLGLAFLVAFSGW